MSLDSLYIRYVIIVFCILKQNLVVSTHRCQFVNDVPFSAALLMFALGACSDLNMIRSNIANSMSRPNCVTKWSEKNHRAFFITASDIFTGCWNSFSGATSNKICTKVITKNPTTLCWVGVVYIAEPRLFPGHYITFSSWLNKALYCLSHFKSRLIAFWLTDWLILANRPTLPFWAIMSAVGLEKKLAYRRERVWDTV